MPARDLDGYLRILSPGDMPFPQDVLDFHEERLRRRAEKELERHRLDLEFAGNCADSPPSNISQSAI